LVIPIQITSLLGGTILFLIQTSIPSRLSWDFLQIGKSVWRSRPLTLHGEKNREFANVIKTYWPYLGGRRSVKNGGRKTKYSVKKCQLKFDKGGSTSIHREAVK